MDNRKTKVIGNKFWSTRGNSHSTSDFWLKDSIFNSDESFFNDDDNTEKQKYDYLKLSQYQNAIGNFVRIMTGRSDISVQYKTSGDANFTDGKKITITPNIKEKKFDYSVGLALHEASHILYTDFHLMLHHFRRHNYKTISEARDRQLLWNLIEDFYIDAASYKSSPGYRGYYSALYQEVFGSPKIEKGFNSKKYSELTLESYFFHLINIRNPKRNLNALPGLREMFDLIDLKNILRLETTQDRIQISNAIYDMIMKYVEQNQDQAPSGGKSENKSDDEDGDSEEDQDFDDLTPKELEAILKQLENQKNFLRGEMKKGNLSKVARNMINALSDIEITTKNVNTNFEFGKVPVPVKIVTKITRKFVESNGGTMFGLSSYSHQAARDRIDSAIVNGKVLAKKLQLRNEERVMKSTRLDTGKIDNRLLHEIGMDNFKVFSKINIESYKPSFIHISLDQSASMGTHRCASMGGPYWNSAISFAATMATVSKILSNIRVIVSTRSSIYQNGKETPYIMTIFDSKTNSIEDIRFMFSHIRPTRSTPEGLVFEALMNQIQSMSRDTDAYFINVCDGSPYYGYGNSVIYTGDQARSHSRNQMKKMESSGIKFMTYFIGDSTYTFNDVVQCYGTNAVHIRHASDIQSIAKTMNKKLLEKK